MSLQDPEKPADPSVQTLAPTPAVPAQGYSPIVEIGGAGLLSHVDPRVASLLWTGEEDLGVPAPANVREFGLREFWRLLRRAWRYDIDMIVVHPTTRHGPLHWRSLKNLFRRPFSPWRRFVRGFGIQALRLLPNRAPLYVIDAGPGRTIAPCHAFLLDRCTYWFKRELPVDRWQVFSSHGAAEPPDHAFRDRARNRRRVEKLRPWALGLETPAADTPAPPPVEKTIGLLVVPERASSTVAASGIAELRALAETRKDVQILDQSFLREEIFEKMRHARLVWSPEGLGWDCERHYEAAFAGAVPVMNRPTIARFHPLLEGEHALFYDPDISGDLTRVVTAALADPARAEKIAAAAQALVVEKHLAPWRRAEQILSYRAGIEPPPGGVAL
ncbi:hypothetical protein A33M_2512 [Rhodovulum sp. PH10]|uniref:glycosyltransferase family protein n=1 Tax=Rhodovulum sp. PH10 TaxID=1187851 RepID=UPI00027C2CC7|nr:glycosyltransferase [Rhodovulum sp. PH10]EJW12035.1 hypothetical protein A33M_2512 [Rhodovulum sp. PH10]